MIKKEMEAHKQLIENTYMYKSVAECAQYVGEQTDKYKSVPVQIAIIGEAGSGKSSFINAVRNLTADDEGGAAVGCNEQTAELSPYADPTNDNLIYWDLPGVGTPRFPKSTYLERIRINDYDFFIIISCTRFTENDAWLTSEISKIGKNYFFVRTKIQHDVDDDKKAHPKTHDKQKLLGSIRSSLARKTSR